MRPLRIALSGKSGTGKSGLADYLVRMHSCVKLSTSESCRRISRLMFGDEQRHHLNAIGDAFRSIDENIWVKSLTRDLAPSTGVVLDSVRHASEAMFLRSIGFEIWRTEVSEEERRHRLSGRPAEDGSAALRSHPSETELDDFEFDFVFVATDPTYRSIAAKLGRD